jgi:hypothetical protein
MDWSRFPVRNLEQEGWQNALKDFLGGYDVEAQGLSAEEIAALEKQLEYSFPRDFRNYLLDFGKTERMDFTPCLLESSEFISLKDSDFEFISHYAEEVFSEDGASDYIQVAGSLGGDPLCFYKRNNVDSESEHSASALFFFSHDPVEKVKVFDSFTQYLLFEILNLQQLMGELEKEEFVKLNYGVLSSDSCDMELRLRSF